MGVLTSPVVICDTLSEHRIIVSVREKCVCVSQPGGLKPASGYLHNNLNMANYINTTSNHRNKTDNLVFFVSYHVPCL